ncbi:MAG: helix-turn-helix domain-containing protein, partial [Gemmataceae bacterium]|nr:helix-turn-helix domain-containing protein [Gemmataceae bacterium]
MTETMDIEQAASYLSRDAREVGKLASRGVLPGRKVGGEWRFARAEIHHWAVARMHEWEADDLRAVESAHAVEIDEPLLTSLLRESTVALPLRASTKGSVLRE